MATYQEARDKLWDKNYQQLLDFIAEHKHARVPSTWHNKTLAKWVSRQREKENTMTHARRQKLDAIGFSWHKNMQQLEEDAWIIKYQQLKSFYKEHRHYRIPSTIDAYHSLRLWVDTQRGGENSISPHRKKMLDDIKFLWTRKIKAEQSENWNALFKELTLYYNKYGNCRVSCHSSEYPKLGKWVLRQRKNWDKLDTRKRNRLLELDFTTTSQIDKDKRVKWLTMLAVLKRYKKEHGHCRVPSKYNINPELGRWVEVQRLEQKKLTEWKKEKLIALGFEWSDNIKSKQEKHWYEMFEKLEKFYKRFGHSSVPEYWKEDHKLAIWTGYQRRPKRPLSPEKVEMLNKISFTWNPSKGRPRKRNVLGQYALR